MSCIPCTVAELHGYLERFDEVMVEGAPHCETAKVRSLLASPDPARLVWTMPAKDEFREMEYVSSVFFDSDGNGANPYEANGWMDVVADRIVEESNPNQPSSITGASHQNPW